MIGYKFIWYTTINPRSIKANIFKDSKSGTSGSNSYKVKGNIHWISIKDSCSVQLNLYDSIFEDYTPGQNVNKLIAQENIPQILNEQSHVQLNSIVEVSILNAKIGEKFQFERHGYFILDKILKNQTRVFNRTVSLKDNWKKG